MLNALYNYIIIFFILLFISRVLSQKYFKLNNKEFIVSLFYHFFLTLFFWFLFQNQPADYKQYLELKHIKEFNVAHSFATTEIVYNFIKILKNILFFNDFNIILSFSLISYFGILIFLKNIVKLGVEKKIAFILFFLPGIHLWTSLPGKDCLILFFLSCFFYMYIDKKLFFSILFVIPVLLIRPQIGVLFLLSIGITEFFLIRGYKKIIIFALSFFLFYLILNSNFASGYLTSKSIFSDNLIFQMLGKISELSLKYNQSDGAYEVNNVVLNIFNYLVFPIDYIFKNNSLIINLTILLESLSLLLVISTIINQRNNLISDKKLIYFLFTCSLIYLMILPQALFNFGLNLRQKWMIIPFLIYLSFLLKNFIVKTNKM